MWRKVVTNVGILVCGDAGVYNLDHVSRCKRNDVHCARTNFAENRSSSSSCSRAALNAESLLGGLKKVKKLAGRFKEYACDSTARNGLSSRFTTRRCK